MPLFIKAFHVYHIFNLRPYRKPTIPVGSTMSVPLSRRRQKLQIDILRIQQKYLRAIQLHHRAWMNDTEDIEIDHLRRDIIDLIGEMAGQYDHLLGAIQRQDVNLESSTSAMSVKEESMIAESDEFRDAPKKKELDLRPAFELCAVNQV